MEHDVDSLEYGVLASRRRRERNQQRQRMNEITVGWALCAAEGAYVCECRRIYEENRHEAESCIWTREIAKYAVASYAAKCADMDAKCGRKRRAPADIKARRRLAISEMARKPAAA